jgi:leucyl-tRNA synthetase
MECVNDLYKLKVSLPYAEYYAVWQTTLSELVQLVSPLAPHIAEELWQQLGHDTSVHVSEWPTFDEKLLYQDTVTIAVQVNGKLRGTITAPADVSEATVSEQARTEAKIASNLAGKEVIKTIYVPGKLLNFVVK